jgi:hypothetical protein
VLAVRFLDEDHHEQVGVVVVDLLEVLLCAEVDVELAVDVGLVAQVVVLKVIKLMEDPFIKKIQKQILLPPQPNPLHLQQVPPIINPPFLIINNNEKLMLLRILMFYRQILIIRPIDQNYTGCHLGLEQTG